MTANDEVNKSGVYAAEVLEFVRLANDYCTWLEESDQQNSVQFIGTAVKVLPEIYHRMLELKETDPVLEGGNEKFVTEQDWSSIFQKILHQLGQHNSYLRLADDQEFDRSDLVTHTISEDLSDIYQDLKDFTYQFRQGIEEIMNDAIWEVMSNFEQYWGVKLLNSLKALHSLYAKKIDPQQDAGGEPRRTEAQPSSRPLGEKGDEEDILRYDNSLFTKLQDSNEEEV